MPTAWFDIHRAAVFQTPPPAGRALNIKETLRSEGAGRPAVMLQPNTSSFDAGSASTGRIPNPKATIASAPHFLAPRNGHNVRA